MRRAAPVFLSFAILGLLALVTPQSAQACTCFCDDLCDFFGDCCPGCGGGVIVAASVSPTNIDGVEGAIVSVSGALTSSMSSGSVCLTSLANLTGVARVERVSLVNVSTNERIYDFEPNERTAPSLEQALAEANAGFRSEWEGFRGQVSQDVSDGLLTKFEIQLTLEPGVSFSTLVEKLRREGAIAGGSGNQDGTYDFHHIFIRPFGALMVTTQVDSQVPASPLDRIQ